MPGQEFHLGGRFHGSRTGVLLRMLGGCRIMPWEDSGFRVDQYRLPNTDPVDSLLECDKKRDLGFFLVFFVF